VLWGGEAREGHVNSRENGSEASAEIPLHSYH
jgi:hypothetical protein